MWIEYILLMGLIVALYQLKNIASRLDDVETTLREANEKLDELTGENDPDMLDDGSYIPTK